MQNGRLLMFGLAASGIGVALSHMPLLTLWFLAGTIRLASFAPTVLSIIRPKMPGIAGTAGIVSGLLIGGPVFGLGAYTNDPTLRTTGMLLSLATSAVMCRYLAPFMVRWVGGGFWGRADSGAVAEGWGRNPEVENVDVAEKVALKSTNR